MAKKATSKKKATAKAKKPQREKNTVGHPLKFPDLDELKANIEAYFAWCNPHLEEGDEVVLMTTGPKKGEFVAIRRPVLTKQRPYTVSGLAFFLGTSRRTLLDYEELAALDSDELPLKLRTKDPALLREYTHTIKKAKLRCEAYVEERLLSGGHPAGPIFNLKNNFARWEDKTVVENPEETENRKAIEELRGQFSGRLKSAKKK